MIMGFIYVNSPSNNTVERRFCLSQIRMILFRPLHSRVITPMLDGKFHQGRQAMQPQLFKTYPKNQEATFFVVKNVVFYNKKSEHFDF